MQIAVLGIYPHAPLVAVLLCMVTAKNLAHNGSNCSPRLLIKSTVPLNFTCVL